MIKEDYVSFEVAKLLKEKKFPRFICHKHYADGEGVWVGNFNKPTPDFKCGELVEVDCGVPTDGSEIDAPTLQMALKWLREVHNIHLSITPFDIEPRVSGRIVRYIPEIYTLPSKGYEMDCVDMNVCNSYEEAANAAILYALKDLIEL